MDFRQGEFPKTFNHYIIGQNCQNWSMTQNISILEKNLKHEMSIYARAKKMLICISSVW